MFDVKRFITLIVTLLCFAPAISLSDTVEGEPEEHPVATGLPVEANPELTEESTRFKFLSKKPKNVHAKTPRN